jgi:integrase
VLVAADGKRDVRKPYKTRDGRTKRPPKLSTRYALVYHILLALGLRRGEALGLSWADLDWEKGTVQVRRQVQQINGKVVVSDSPKPTLAGAPCRLPRSSWSGCVRTGGTSRRSAP